MKTIKELLKNGLTACRQRSRAALEWKRRVCHSGDVRIAKMCRGFTEDVSERAKKWEQRLHPELAAPASSVDPAPLKSGIEGSLFVMDAWEIDTLMSHLTPGPDEEICYVTGPEYEGARIASRIVALQLDAQSVVRAWANPQSCSDALIEMIDRGYRLHIMAHSHPGSGAAATCPSTIDTDYLGKIQRNGSDVIGLIVTRDRFFRFFTVERPFQVDLRGDGITKVSENVYRLETP